MSRANPPAAPYAQSRRGGGDTLAIWRWQGKASRIKALTMKGTATGSDQEMTDPWRGLGSTRVKPHCPATRAAPNRLFMTAGGICAAAARWWGPTIPGCPKALWAGEVDIAVRSLA